MNAAGKLRQNHNGYVVRRQVHATYVEQLIPYVRAVDSHGHVRNMKALKVLVGHSPHLSIAWKVDLR